MSDLMIAALRREHAAYTARGMTERAEQVAAQLKRFGTEPTEPTEQHGTEPVDAPKRRRAPAPVTAAAPAVLETDESA